MPSKVWWIKKEESSLDRPSKAGEVNRFCLQKPQKTDNGCEIGISTVNLKPLPGSA